MGGYMSRTRYGKSRGAGRKNPGAAKLSKCADQLVGDNACELVNALIKATLAGNATAAGILFDLADGADWTETAETARRVLSLAEAWAAEPQWNGDPADAETAAEQEVPVLLLPASTNR